MDYPAACSFGIPPAIRYDPHDLDPDRDADLAPFHPEFGLLSDLDFDGDVEFCIDDLLDFHDAEDPPPAPPPPADSSSRGSGGPAASSSSSAPAAGPADSSGNSSPHCGDNYAAATSPESGGSSTKPSPPAPPPVSEARVIEEEEEVDEPSDGNKPDSGRLKRKKESSEDDESDETNARSSTAADAAATVPSSGKSRSRIRRATPAPPPAPAAADEADSSAACGSGGGDEDDKRRARLMRNRESAQLSRQRKKQYVEELEEKVRAMHSTISDLNSKISYIMAENATLRHQLGATAAAAGSGTGNGHNGKSQGASPSSNSAAPIPAVLPPPGVGVYPAVPPMGPMPFPWIHGYAVRPPPGAQVPLVPIPRLRTQQVAPPAKTRKTSDGGKKGESKTKKVASVSLLGMMLFLLLVGAFVPRGNLRMGGGSSFSINGAVNPSRGRVLTVTGNFDRFNLTHGNVDPVPPDRKRPAARELQHGKLDVKGTQGSSLPANATEPLLASLYVPRNDKLVKIDGNLIISSVLASEKAMAHRSSRDKVQNKPTVISGNGNNKESDLALAGSVASALAVASAQRLSGRSRRPVNPKALPSGPRDVYRETLKSIPADRPTQEWFKEGLEGPILSSGMCTEVFQFDASPASGSIVPATSAVNATNNQTGQTPYPENIKSRRILYPQQPVPLAGPSQVNNTNKAFGGGPGNFGHSKASKSIVVSVLLDPREVGDGDVDGVLSPKPISRIFVVVLVDNVKYITYSCVLPFKTNAPHLVTA